MEAVISDRYRNLLRRIRHHIQWLQKQLQDIDSEIVAAIEPYRLEWQLLQTIPGMDEMSAAMLLVEIGPDMSAFKDKSRISSWAGMCPGNKASSGKKKSQRTRTGTSRPFFVNQRKAHEKQQASSSRYSKGS